MPKVPSRSTYDPVLDVHLHTGANARDTLEHCHRLAARIALDIETPGLDRAFEINCVTMCFVDPDDRRTHAVLLDPARNDDDHKIAHKIIEAAAGVILHNAPFDIPALVHHGLMSLDTVEHRIVDTLLLARFAYPDVKVRKSLSALAKKHLGMDDNAEGMKLAFKAAGFKTIDSGYAGMDIDSPIYRQGAMLDTLATLRLEPILRREGRSWSQNHPFSEYGATCLAEADNLIHAQEQVHRTMLKRTAVGINVDHDYLATYTEQVDLQRQRAEATLAAADLAGGKGKGPKIIAHIDAIGELPEGWPRTPTGNLKATKELLETLDHPLINAQRTLSDTDQVLGYLRKVDLQAEVTGRCHPQVGVLGASATGRMSAVEPPYQQFSAGARPIFLSDNPDADDNVEWADDGKGGQVSRCVGPGRQLWSIDWSQIEPVTMGLMAGDDEFLAPFEAGEDLYEPIQRAAGIDRPTAKVVVLASMYGLGLKGLAAKINTSDERAAQIKRQMFSAMKASARWMTKVETIADEYGKVITAAGRILPSDKGFAYKAVNKEVQGSAYDFLAHTILKMREAPWTPDGWLADTIVLAMHDELVVDATEAQAIEIEKIMLTPPPWIVKWAGRVPTLRCDRQPLGRSWRKV